MKEPASKRDRPEGAVEKPEDEGPYQEGPGASLKPVNDGHEPAAGDLPQATVDLSSPERSSAPGLPNERDETVGMTGGVPDKRVEQAYVDVSDGKQDTSRGIESDRTYQRQKEDPSGSDGAGG